MAVFFVRSEQRLYNQKPSVEAESNTSTVALRVGGDENGKTAKYGRESHGTRIRE
jgi:hypothetical protein